jgi:hypothetical protein
MLMPITIPMAALKLIMCHKGDVSVTSVDISEKGVGFMSFTYRGMDFYVPVDTERALEELAKAKKKARAKPKPKPLVTLSKGTEEALKKKQALVTATSEEKQFMMYKKKRCHAIMQTQRPPRAITKRRVRDQFGRKVWPVPVLPGEE